jgi:type III pantothenate kinase
MLCAVDIGNTHTVLGLFDGEQLVERWRLRTEPERTTDEWGIQLSNLFHLARREMGGVDAVAVASVVPPAIHAFRRSCRRAFEVDPLIIEPGVKTGLAIRLDSPREVGADRVVNAVAAYSRWGGPAIVVDFGTATTFDCLSSKGEYLGGAITPGILTSLEALVQRAAKLPRVPIDKPRSPVGKNTVESMQSGTLYGYVSLVDGLVARLSNEIAPGQEVHIIATGGLAGTISQESSTIQHVEPNLTLEGLRLIWKKNESE